MISKGAKELIFISAGVVVSAIGSIISDVKMKRAVEAEVKKQRELEDKEENENKEEA